MKIPFVARLIINKFFFHKLVAVSLLIIFFTVFKDFFLIFLFTFLFAYLFLDLTRWLQTTIINGLQVTQSNILQYIRKFFQSEARIVSVLYIIFVCALIFLFSSLIPQLLTEGKGLLQDIPRYFQSLQNAAHALESGSSVPLGISENISKIVSPEAVESGLKSLIENLKNIGLFIIKICIALILGFVFIHDRKKIGKFLTSMKRGSFGFIYDEYEIIFEKVSRGFGLIFKAQSIIAAVNAALTTLGLLCISLLYHGGTFPYITTIALMVFIFGFIPVLGFIISSVPIIILAYNYGGAEVVALCMLMIAVVHAIEAYYLNPKIVSSYMEFPVFVTFMILLISEHFFGFIGLLVGVPLFYILLDILGDVDTYIGKISRISQSIQTLKTDTNTPIQKNVRLSRSQNFHKNEGNSPQ